ncbi:serine/threonine protein kinase [candidate division KSB1 bacterium]|nr:serine/threonine protein kinase [candidate division KSB1 bacterium]
MIGETILHYKIIEKIGEGGMGVVYKARDTKLDRVVALKFLPEDLLRDKTAKERFTQEAKSASKLDHPNICTIHAVEEVDDRLFIAMAYYEGETLQEVIDKGPMKIDEVLTITNKVADGLHEAHSKGIVHRDIKPSNIMLTDRGQVKIMDFGLAKSIAGSLVTKAGTTLGTIGFMSPEQSRGEEVDSRTDIWSLGVLLYYMLAGQSPFKGEYEQAIIYSILNTEPEPVTGIRTGVPVELENYIGKCLEKDREDRYPAVDGLIVDLRRLKKDTSKMSAAVSQITPPEIAAVVPETIQKPADRGSTTIVIPGKKVLLKYALAAVAVIALAFFGRV